MMIITDYMIKTKLRPSNDKLTSDKFFVTVGVEAGRPHEADGKDRAWSTKHFKAGTRYELRLATTLDPDGMLLMMSPGFPVEEANLRLIYPHDPTPSTVIVTPTEDCKLTDMYFDFFVEGQYPHFSKKGPIND